MQFTLELVTPEIAKQYLLANITRNRNVQPNRVKFYAKQMRAKQWHPSPQGISFDVNGHMVDGQHRLAAIVEAGVPVEMVIIRDVPLQCFGVLDSGMGRTLAFRADMKTVTAAVAGAIHRFVGGNFAATIGVDDLAATYDIFKKEVDAVSNARSMPKISVAPIMAAVAIHMKQGNHYAFLQYKAMTEFDTSALTPCVANFMRSIIDKSNVSGSSVDRMILFLRAYKALIASNAQKAYVSIRTDEGMKERLQRAVRRYLDAGHSEEVM